MDEKSLAESPENRVASWQEILTEDARQAETERAGWRYRMAAWAKDHMDIRSLDNGC